MTSYDIVDEYGVDFKYDYLNDVIKKTFSLLNIENAYFSLIFIDDEKMCDLNTNYRGINRTTDVLSFAFEDNLNYSSPIRYLGDIFISIPKMNAQAIDYNHSVKRELSFLTVHGLLHLLGYDHTKSKEEELIQFGLQDQILNDLGIVS